MQKQKIYAVKRSLYSGYINKVILTVFPFILRSIFVRKLGSEYLGLNSLFTSVLQILSLSELGISEAFLYCMYEPIEKQNNKDVCSLLNLFRRVYYFVGIIIISLGLFLVPFIPKLISGNVPLSINIYIVYIIYLVNSAVSYFAGAYRSSILIASQNRDIIYNINSFWMIALYILQGITLIIFRNYYLYAILTIFSSIVINLSISKVTARLFPNYYCKGKISNSQKKEITKQIKGIFISKFCKTTRNGIDSICISKFVGLNAVAIYNNYYCIFSGIISILSMLIRSVEATIAVDVVNYNVKTNYNKFKNYCFIYGWISSVCTACLLCLYQPLMKIWMGYNMLFPFHMVILLCIYFYSCSMGTVLSIYINVCGLWYESRFRTTIEAISNIILNIVLGYFYGIEGIIIATNISIILFGVLYGGIVAFKEYFGMKYVLQYFFSQIIRLMICLIICLFTYKLCNLFILDGLLGILIQAILALFIANGLFSIIYFRTDCFKESIQLIKKLLRSTPSAFNRNYGKDSK